jgi:hypothetical protein
MQSACVQNERASELLSQPEANVGIGRCMLGIWNLLAVRTSRSLRWSVKMLPAPPCQRSHATIHKQRPVASVIPSMSTRTTIFCACLFARSPRTEAPNNCFPRFWRTSEGINSLIH